MSDTSMNRKHGIASIAAMTAEIAALMRVRI